MKVQKPKPPDFQFKCVKTSLKSIVRDDLSDNSTIIILNELIVRCHKITINCLQFIKLVQLYRFENNMGLYKVDGPFITECLKIVCKPLKGDPSEETLI